MKSIFKDLAQYNIWANKRAIALLNTNSSLLNSPTHNSFSTLLDTIRHIWFAEEIWLKRLKQEEITHLKSRTFDGQSVELLEAFIQNSIDFQEFISRQSNDFFEQNCYYQDTKGVKYHQLNREIITHTMNHSTYHRGQIITMLRTLGATNMQAMDYIWYLREKHK